MAYKAACDLLIDQDTFLEEAIGVIPTQSARTEGPATTAMQELLRRIADKAYERASAVGELVATDLPGIFREFPEFTSSTNWLGFNSLRNMATAVTQARSDLLMIDGDPWKVRIGEALEDEAGVEAAGRERLAHPFRPLDYSRLIHRRSWSTCARWWRPPIRRCHVEAKPLEGVQFSASLDDVEVQLNRFEKVEPGTDIC